MAATSATLAMVEDIARLSWDTTFLYSKVARRMFGLFILCALLPVTALTVISFREVTQQLEGDSRRHLRQAAKSEGMAMYERLQFLVDDLGTIASALRGASPDSNPFLLGGVGRDTSDLFRGIGVMSANGDLEVIFGTMDSVPEITEVQKEHLQSGSTVLMNFACASSARCPRLLRYLDWRHPEKGLLIGDPRPDYLWDSDKLPAATKLCVVDESGYSIYCSGNAGNEIRAALAGTSGSGGNLEWRDQHRSYLAGYWTIFLRAKLHSPAWTVVLSESRADVLLPLEKFARVFLPLNTLALLVVLLLSFIQIRRSLVPLEALEKGTRQISNRQFDARVKVTSGDEFQELAESFNRMAADLGRQFRALETVRDIDRAILSSLDRRDIVNRALRRVRALLPYDAISVTLLDSSQLDRAVTYVAADEKHSRIRVVGNTLEPEEVQELRDATDIFEVDAALRTRTYLEAVTTRGARRCLIVPIRRDNQLFGVLTLGSPAAIETADDMGYAKQFADRLAVGLSNARLLEEMDKVNMGTLTALARAIDAKSTWTAGHSERVTNMAVQIGRAMGLSEKELSIMHRGGLLHDIGKIGTPPEILDKCDKLSANEMKVMCEHVNTGARILEPIPGFAELIPIVIQHHERFDGSGYPYGLAGEAISLHARIFAVADVYDALISNRPYRPGWPKEKVIAYIVQKAGTHFDPRVVEAFVRVMEKLQQEPRSENSLEAMAEAAGGNGR